MISLSADLDWPDRPGVHALIMPPRSRRIEMRVFHKPGNPGRLQPDGTFAVTPVLELAPATWLPCPEGEFSGNPFSEGTDENDLGPLAVLQAMVDLGHRIGLTPRGEADRSKEIAALRYHLEDMRRLVGAARGIALPGQQEVRKS